MLRFLMLLPIWLLCACSAFNLRPKPTPLKPVSQTPILACAHTQVPAYQYKKRIAVLLAPLSQRKDSVDLPYIETEWAQELAFRLSQQQRLMAMTPDLDFPPFTRADFQINPNPDQVQQLAKQLNVQFLVASQILDMSLHQDTTHLYAVIKRDQSFKQYRHHLTQRLNGQYQRQWQLEFTVYDGASGLALRRERYSERGLFKPHYGDQQSLKKSAFWKTPYGEVISAQLNHQNKVIHEILDCLPLQTHITLVNQDEIEINAGLELGLHTGDQLKVFHNDFIGRDHLGNPKYKWIHIGDITLTASSLSAALGAFHTKTGQRPTAGDLVQAW